MPGWTIDKAQGSPRTVGGRPAKLVEHRPGLCKAIGGDKSISVVIAGQTTDNFYGLDACFRGPGEPTAVRWVQRMLTSTRIKGP